MLMNEDEVIVDNDECEVTQKDLHIDPRIKFSKLEKKLINKKIYECTEDEKLTRKFCLQKIQDYEQKKNYHKKKKDRFKHEIEKCEKILNFNSKGSKLSPYSNIMKYKECKKLALFLIKHGKEKTGLQYFRIGIKLKEETYASDSFSVLQDYYMLDKLESQYRKKYSKKEKV